MSERNCAYTKSFLKTIRQDNNVRAPIRGGDKTQAPRPWARGMRPNSFDNCSNYLACEAQIQDSAQRRPGACCQPGSAHGSKLHSCPCKLELLLVNVIQKSQVGNQDFPPIPNLTEALSPRSLSHHEDGELTRKLPLGPHDGCFEGLLPLPRSHYQNTRRQCLVYKS